MKKIIAIICGGDTSEHDVSMRSAAGIESFLDKDRYIIYPGSSWNAGACQA